MNGKRFLMMTAALAAAGSVVLTACSSSSTGTAVAPTSSAAVSASVAAPASSPAVSSPAVSSPAASAPAVSSAPAAPISSPSSPSSAVADVKTAKTSLGQTIVTAKGMTVYFFKPDVANSGKSACSGACLSAWPAVTPSGASAVGAGITGKLGVITRSDGTKQVTVDGRPIYLFAGDKAPGDVNGQDVKDAWYAVAPSGSQIGS